MPRYLFVHQNFPGQFPHVGRALAARGDTVVAIGEAERLTQRPTPHPDIRRIGYPTPDGAGPATHAYLRGLEAHVRRGQAVFRVTQRLHADGFRPDVVVAHPGWGEALFLREAFPHARHLHYLEFYYRPDGADFGFDPEFPATIDDRCRVHVKNATQLLSFDGADSGLSPTTWQRSRYPTDWQSRITQCHDGIDTDTVCPDSAAAFTVKVGAGDTALHLTAHDEVVTYVARNLEPYRGFHTLMRAIPELLERRPKARILVIGGDEVSYGRAPAGAKTGATYRQQYQSAWGSDVDTRRVHFLGRVPYRDYLSIVQISSLHLYLTYPFVLSWSLLEAMSAGCAVLASATPPVKEVIQNGVNGWLTDFFDAPALARRAAELLTHRADLAPMRQAARETIRQRYDLHRICLPQMLRTIAGETRL
jgi:glycosyltransferase involved in cell wall biosynthesis